MGAVALKGESGQAISQSAPPVLIEITRGSLVDVRYRGHIVVCDTEGRLLAHVGYPDEVAFLRSSAKPLQALALLESGAADHFKFTDRELAVICASHGGSPHHTEAVAGILAKLGLTVDALKCGIHWPATKEASLALRVAGAEPTALHNNCSGKHAGMLALASILRASLGDYLEPAHPVQQTILRTLAEMAGIERDEISIAIDGCSVPTFAMPLRAAARAFARLADPGTLSAAQMTACRRVVKAMQTHPEMVADWGKFDTELMRTAQGRLVSKGGAAGYGAVAVLPGALGVGSAAMGIVMKLEDGASEYGRQPATLEVLRQLGVLSEGELSALQRFGSRPIRNHRQIVVGELRPVFSLIWD